MKKANSAVTVLIVFVVVIFTSAIILLLINQGVLNVKAQENQPPILNTNFIPLQREGTINVNPLIFCTQISPENECLLPSQKFTQGDLVHFQFTTTTTSTADQVTLIYNYQLIGPEGQVLIQASPNSAIAVNKEVSNNPASITISDYFFTELTDPTGEYELQLQVYNPQIAKQQTLQKTVTILEYEQD